MSGEVVMNAIGGLPIRMIVGVVLALLGVIAAVAMGLAARLRKIDARVVVFEFGMEDDRTSV